MTVRKYSAGLAAAALVATSLSLAALAPASAEPTFTPDANDIVGVGSDTIEIVVDDLAKGKTVNGAHVNGWNDTHADVRLASFDATGTSPVVLRQGSPAVTRPNGSGSGKATLFGAGNNPDVSFARSSSTLSTSNGESAALTQFPFAVDGLKLAVSGAVASHAPASISAADMVKIYDGTYKHWNEIPGNAGGSTAAIHPLTPQPGSGTRSFFDSELKAANGGVAVVYGTASGDYPGVQQTQEHDPSLVQDDADAIAPFSTARAQILADPSVIKLEGGFTAKRAVYDVVRNADAGAAWVTDLFGSGGFFCSAAAKPIIEADGLEQLATPANGGVCGVGGTTAVSNFTSNTVATTTTLAATSPAGRQVSLTATVAAGGAAADGTLEFYEGATKVASGPLTGGQRTATLSNVTPGAHTYTATFVSGNPASFTDSTSAGQDVTVKEASTTTATVVKGSYGHPGSATVSVTAAGNPGAGSVTVKVGAVVLGTKPLSAGAASFALPATLPAGATAVQATYSGDATTAASVGTKAFTIAKSAVTMAETFPAKTKPGKRAKGTVVVALSPGSGVKATGTVVVKRGSKVVGKGTLVNGVATVKLAKLPKGKNTLVATYGGSANTLARALTFTIKQK